MKILINAWYLFGLWVIMSVAPRNAGELMIRWGKYLIKNEKD